MCDDIFTLFNIKIFILQRLFIQIPIICTHKIIKNSQFPESVLTKDRQVFSKNPNYGGVKPRIDPPPLPLHHLFLIPLQFSHPLSS